MRDEVPEMEQTHTWEDEVVPMTCNDFCVEDMSMMLLILFYSSIFIPMDPKDMSKMKCNCVYILFRIVRALPLPFPPSIKVWQLLQSIFG